MPLAATRVQRLEHLDREALERQVLAACHLRQLVARSTQRPQQVQVGLVAEHRRLRLAGDVRHVGEVVVVPVVHEDRVRSTDVAVDHLGLALERIGFEVERRVARVQPQRPGPRTHMLLLVRVDGQEFLADVGFGAGMLHPMPLKDGVVIDQAGWDHQLTVDGDLWTLSKKTVDGWVPQHASDDEPQLLIDFVVAHHYVSTHPNSPFSTQLVVMRLEQGISRRLVGDKYTVEYADGRRTERLVQKDELVALLAELDIDLNPEEQYRLLHVL